MNTILSVIERLANWRWLTILIVLYSVVFGSIIASLSRLTALTGGTGILDFDRGYSVERVREVFDSYGAEGFALYGRIQLLDLLNPAIYSLIFASLIDLLWRARGHYWSVIFPLAAGLFEYCENLTLFFLSRTYPEISLQLVTISSTLSLIKNVGLFGTITVLVIGVYIWFRGRFNSKNKA
jgi:hypothetical protein